MSLQLKLKSLTVDVLNGLCNAVDQIAYRPAVVKLTERLPRWWNCQLAAVAVRLARRWETGQWEDWGPGSPCDICGRRAAWLVIGGIEEDEELEPEATYLERHPIDVCFWCRLPAHSLPVEDRAQLDRLMAEERSRTVSWRWRRAPLR